MVLKSTLKRGALIAAANWQVTLIQAIADSLFKLLLAVPILGGVFLVVLVIGAEPRDLAQLDWRDLITTIVAALMGAPIVLVPFLLSLGVVVIGGSIFVFLVKGGAVAILVAGDAYAGPVEQPPLHFAKVARAARFSVEGYIDGCRALFPRFLRLGVGLMSVYLLSAAAYFVVVSSGGWGLTAVFSAVFVAWITLVNLIYLLLQIVVAADDCAIGDAVRRVTAFVRAELRSIAAVFAVVLALVVCATGASLLAIAAFGLIAFVPFFGLAALPLHILASLLRSVVFQYVGLTAAAAYLHLYRGFAARPAPRRLRDLAPVGPNPVAS